MQSPLRRLHLMSTLSLALVSAATASAAAASLEGMSAAAESQFFAQATAPLPQSMKFTPTGDGPGVPIDASSLVRMHNPKPSRPNQPAALVKDIDLSALLNRNLRTTINFNLGGASVYVSGSFDEAQNAYVSILEDGKAPQFFNVMQLLGNPKILDLGTGKYKLRVSPDLSDLLDSEIVLSNTVNSRDSQRTVLRDMLNAIAATGEPVAIGAETYRVFYYDEVNVPGRRLFVFLLADAHGEYHVFLIPTDLVPSAKPAVFKMNGNASIGLQQVSGRLKVFRD